MTVGKTKFRKHNKLSLKANKKMNVNYSRPLVKIASSIENHL